MFLKCYPLEAKNAPKNWNQSVHIFWARLASFGHLGISSDPLIVSKYHNEAHGPKVKKKIYTIVKGRETFYRRHTVPVTSCSEVKYVLKRVSFGNKKYASKNWNQSVHIFLARLASFGHLGLISDPLIVSKFHNETHDPKGQENKIYTIVKGRETFNRRHTVPVTSCSEVKYVL